MPDYLVLAHTGVGLLLHQGGDNEYNVYNGLGLLRHPQPGMWSVAWPWSAGELMEPVCGKPVPSGSILSIVRV